MDTTNPITTITWTDHYFNQSLTDQGTLDPPVNCPYCGATGSFAVSIYINFECSTCRKKDFAFRIPADLEGIPIDSANAHFEVVTGRSADVTLPTPDVLKAWEDALFDAKHAELRNLLETTYGFDQSDLQKGHFGFDGAKHEVVLPLMNATGLNVSGVCYLELAAEGSIKDSRADSVVRLSGYDLRKWNTGGALVLLTDNELDRLHFAKLGLLCICCSAGFAEWDDSFTRLLKGREVAAALTEASFNSDDALKVLKSISAKSKRLVRLPVSTLRRRPRAEIEEVVRISPSLTMDNIQSISNIQEVQKQTTMVTMIHPSQDFVDGLMIYGVMIGDKVNLLTSERELLPITPEGKYQLVVEYDDWHRLGLDAVEHFIDGSLSVKPDELLQEIIAYIKRFVVLTQQDTYTVLASWVMGTYIFRVFDSFPYIHLQAEKGSGKTRLMDVLHPVCFNGEFSSNQTPTVIFRSVHHSACSMFLDEVEYLRKADTATHGDIMRILNSGYQASGNVKRAGKNDSVKEYSTYSPKMFAGINELTDTLDQRSISIRMVRALGHETVERYNGERSDILELHTRLRNKLYVFGLQYAATCAGMYANLLTNSFMADVFNRKADLWGPLFVVAQLADESRNDGKTTHQESLKSYMDVEERLHARANEEDNITRSLALAMKQVLKRVPPVSADGADTIVRTEDVFNFVNSDPDFKGKVKSVNKLTSLLAEKLRIAVSVRTIEGHTTRCYVINREWLNDDGLRVDAWTQDDLDRETQTMIRTTQPFIPKRVIITEKSQVNPLALRMLERIRLLNPGVLVETYDGEKIPEPNILNNKELYEYYAETMVLASRSSNFIEVFAAPGAIVEEMNTMCKILQHCSSRCQFCYLQVAGQDPARWQKLWTNLDDLGHQCDVEMLFNKTALTLWSTISFYKEEPFPKVPEGFKELVDQMRNMFLRKEDPIATDEAAKRYLETALADILLVKLGLDHNPKRFDEVKANVRSYYNENAKLKLWINIGEYSDIVAVDHITGYLELFMKMLEAKPELRLEFSTKSANIENVLKYPAFKRLCVGMNFNTEHMIDRYEGGTASLEERFAAVKLLLEKGDVLVKFTIEPIIKYDGYEEDYRRLARRIAEELPLADPRIVSIKVGGPRFRKQLAQEIQKNHPGIDLFTSYQGLVEPEEKDQRMRYPVKERLAIYRILMAEFKDAGGKLVLGCEFPRVWEELGLDWKAHIARHVHQYSGTT